MSCKQAKELRKLRIPLQSIEMSGISEGEQSDHQKICMKAIG